MFDLVEMPKNWPVEVNYHEAKAFCNWKGNGYRLITEAEHHAIRDTEVRKLALIFFLINLATGIQLLVKYFFVILVLPSKFGK